MFYIFFIGLGLMVFCSWKKNDLELLSMKSDTKALSRSLGGSTQAAGWLQNYILDFEKGWVSYLPFLASLGDLGENIRRHNRKLVSCYSAKSCHILVIFVVMSSLNFTSSTNFCLVILIFSGLAVYSLNSGNRSHLLCEIKDLVKKSDGVSVEIDFALLNEASELMFKKKHTLLATMGTVAELAMFLFGLTQASHLLEG